MQLLVRASDGQVVTTLPDAHAWGVCERWPDFVALEVPGSEASVRVALDSARGEDGAVFLDVDALSTESIATLASSGKAATPLATLELGPLPGSVAALVVATAPRSQEAGAFRAWHAALGELGASPADPAKVAAEVAARAAWQATLSGQQVGAVRGKPR